MYASLAGLILIDLDVGLGLAVHEVEVVTNNGLAVLNLFKVYVNSIVNLIGSSKEVAVHSACEVEILAKSVLCKIELVSSILSGSFYVLGNVKVGGNSVNCDGEGLGVGNCSVALADGSGSGKSKGNLLLTELDYELAVLGDGVSSVVNCPCNLNLGGVCGTCKRKSDGGVLGNLVGYGDVTKLKSNLLCGGSLDLGDVGKCVNVNGVEVDLAVVSHNDTGYVCLLAEGARVSCDDSSLVVCIKHGTVGVVNSDVGLDAVKLELVVLRGLNLGLLTGDLNALDGYKSGLEYGKSSVSLGLCSLEDIGDINGSYRGDSGGLDLCGSVLDLVSAGIDILDTGDLNGHTNLNAEIGNGILSHAVSVVAAVCILDVEVVVLAACGLGGSCGNNTDYNYGVACLSSDVIVV